MKVQDILDVPKSLPREFIEYPPFYSLSYNAYILRFVSRSVRDEFEYLALVTNEEDIPNLLGFYRDNALRRFREEFPSAHNH